MISLRVRSRFRSNTKVQKGLKLKTAPLIFSKTAPLYKKTANFEPWWSTPLLVLKTALRSIFDSSERFIIAGAFQKVQSRLHFQNICFFPSFLFLPGGSIPWFKFSTYNMRSFSDTGVFVKLEFSWDLNFRESWKVQFHANSSPRELQFHGDVARQKSSPCSFN